MLASSSIVVRLGMGLVAVLVMAFLLCGCANAGLKDRKHLAIFALGGWSWMALTGTIAASGALTHWERLPPPMVPLALLSMGGAVALSRSATGACLAKGLPLAALVGFQAFRFPLELLMHQAAAEGTMPAQMSFGAGGCNYDVLTGLSAIVVSVLAAQGKASRTLLHVWNYMGLALLAAIVVVAVISTPTFAAFGPTRLNTWIAYFPFVLLITVMVPAALLGHLLVLRRLRG